MSSPKAGNGIRDQMVPEVSGSELRLSGEVGGVESH